MLVSFCFLLTCKLKCHTASAKKLLTIVYKKAGLPWLKVLTMLPLNISRNTQYSVISILFSFGSIAVFGIILLAAFFMHKKIKEYLPSEKDHKDAVRNINNDNTPDTKVEPEFAKKQQPIGANSQLLQDAIKQSNDLGGNENSQDFQQKSQSNINEKENPPVELSKDGSENSDVGDVKDIKGGTGEENTKDDNNVIKDDNKNQNKEFLNLQDHNSKTTNKVLGMA